jgi:hypothetical protein
MSFAGMNYLAILVAAGAAWIFGAGYYGALAKPWLAASGRTLEDIMAKQGTPAGYAPYILSLICEVIMAWVLAGVIGHLGPGQVTLRNGVIAAAFIWFGFVITTLAVNYAYGGRRPLLTVIDGLHWLGALVIMGAVIGAWGV